MSKLGFVFLSLFLSTVCSAQNAPKADVGITVLPTRPLIEHRGDNRILNFDFLIHNNGAKPLHMSRIQISLYDNNGKLAWQREVDENGHPSGMSTIEERDVKPGDAIAVFNPFYQFGPDLPLDRVYIMATLPVGSTWPGVKPWLMKNGSQFRPGAPPRFDQPGVGPRLQRN